MKRSTLVARLSVVAAMVIFGTIGVVRTYLPSIPSGLLAAMRGVVGALFLLAVLCLRGRRLDRAAIRKNLAGLILSGVLMGFNWILLFEAYRYTSVATATLCYYMAPVLVVLASPLVLGERLSARRMCCVIVAIGGMIPVSGVLRADFGGSGELVGVLLGLGAAVLYACVVLINQRMCDIGPYDKTIVQLAAAGVALIPYSLLAEDWQTVAWSVPTVLWVGVVCIVHTGLAYALYFGAMGKVPSQTVALLSYIDPVVAVVLSATLLRQGMDAAGWIGAVLVLGATVLGELPTKKKAAQDALCFEVAAPSQYNEIIALYERVIATLAEDGINIYWDLDGHPSRAYLKEKIEQGELYIAVQSGRVVGAFVADQCPRAEYAAVPWGGAWRDDEVLLMHVLAVHPEARGRGVATFLLNHLKDLCRARGLRAVRLDALTCNTPACVLYHRAGFTVVQSRTFPLPDVGEVDFEVFEFIV